MVEKRHRSHPQGGGDPVGRGADSVKEGMITAQPGRPRLEQQP